MVDGKKKSLKDVVLGIGNNVVNGNSFDFSTIEKLIDALDDLEDVQNVYSNYKVKSN